MKQFSMMSKIAGMALTVATTLWNQGPVVVDWLDIAAYARTMLVAAEPVTERPPGKPLWLVRH